MPFRPLQSVIAMSLVAVAALAPVGSATAAPGVAGSPKVAVWMNEAPGIVPTAEEAVEDAKTFDLISANLRQYKANVGAMRQANPDLTLIGYMKGVNTPTGSYPEAWYSHDSAGHRFKNMTWNVFLMDPGNAQWRVDRGQECLDAISSTGYDGCFLDSMGIGGLKASNTCVNASGAEVACTSGPINPRTGLEWTNAQWLDAGAGLVSAVKSAVGATHPVWVNGLGNGPRYYNEPASRLLANTGDGGMAEAYLRPAHADINAFPTEAAWKQNVDMVVDAEAKGKGVAGLLKVWVSATAAQIDRWHEYGLATFLLGAEGRSVFVYNPHGYGEDPTAPHAWWKTRLGAPAGAYAKTQGVYQRSFEHGRVLVNPTPNSIVVDLGGTYTDLSGASMTSITMPSNTGRLLLKATASADTTAPAVPAALSATAGNGSVTLAWTANDEPDLAAYRVVHRVSGATTWSVVGETTNTTVSVTNLTNGTAYEFQVRAIDTSGNLSTWLGNLATATPIDDQAPAAPANLVAMAGDSSITLDWSDSPEADFDHYRVLYKRSADTVWTVLTTTWSDHTLLALANGTTYDLQVRAVDSSGNLSVWLGNTATATPVDAAPAAPTGLVADPGSQSVRLAWNPNADSDLKHYAVIYRAKGAASWTSATTTTSTAATVGSLRNGTTYEFQVRAWDNAGQVSAWLGNYVASTPCKSC